MRDRKKSKSKANGYAGRMENRVPWTGSAFRERERERSKSLELELELELGARNMELTQLRKTSVHRAFHSAHFHLTRMQICR